MAPSQSHINSILVSNSLMAANATVASLASNMSAPIMTTYCCIPEHAVCGIEAKRLPCNVNGNSSQCSDLDAVFEHAGFNMSQFQILNCSTTECNSIEATVRPMLDARTVLPYCRAAEPEHIVVDPSVAEHTDNDNATSAASSGNLTRRNIGHPDIADIVVNAHNRVRAKHGAPPLRWSQDLANSAQATADMCILAHNTAIGSETGKYGQNIASWGTTGVETRTIAELVIDGVEQQWYHGEIAKYPGYGQAQPDMANFHDWGHFSQAVWAGTSEVGCGIQACPVDTLFPGHGMSGNVMFCNYRAPGNAPGKYADNVKAPTS
ncbi:scp-like extracellular protein [Ophiostoma piceae UAMH 11346]|uniref:Scp-like extracellular protein n=1 Tax=Ophiostoma piceae (strain UAMH 11346) TaxID=1262450 RepID=S3CAB8_OPHP1|nr:scp-like extracellular protein [Ophiostoma piceae UAMH 11346]